MIELLDQRFLAAGFAELSAATGAGWTIDRPGFLVLLILICGAVVLSSLLARKRPGYVRPIAGLGAIEEAVGRATETGRPVMFVPGVMDLNEIQTVAGVTLLSRVAYTCARYDTPLLVPTSRTLVMAACREAVEAGCLRAGRPDAYNAENIQYITDEQFGYVAYVCGAMLREKPAACFYAGQFFAESLLLAETGNSVGAIQIAGTAESSQLPFFVAASDYTLIGEELFAASAYLSGDRQQLSTLRGQDWGKLLAASLLLTGVMLETIRALWPDAAWPADFLNGLKSGLMG